MSTYINRYSISLVAAADLSTKQYNAVKIDSNGQAALAGLGEAGIGILVNDPVAGQSASIQIAGVAKAKAGGNIAAGAAVAANASGVMVTASAGNYIIGFAKEAAASGDTFAVVLRSMGKV